MPSSSFSSEVSHEAPSPLPRRWPLLLGTVPLLLGAIAAVWLDEGRYALLLLIILLAFLVHHFAFLRRERRSGRELARLNAELRRALRESERLSEVGKEISGQVRLDALLDLVAKSARDLLGADCAGVAIVEEETGATAWMAAVGFHSGLRKDLIRPPGKGLAGRAIASGRPVVVENLREDPAFPVEEFPYHHAEGTVSAITVPLARGGRALGALEVTYRHRHDFSEREISFLGILASQAAVSIENARLYEAEKRKAAELIAVIDHLSDGVIVTDGKGAIVQCNEAAMLLIGPIKQGESLLDLSRRGIIQVESPAGKPLPLDDWPMLRAAYGERFTAREVMVRRTDGSVRHLSVDGRPVVNEKDDVVLGVTVMHDVTGAREMDLLKDEFLSLAAHEMKTPLTSLKGYAQILLRAGIPSLGERHRGALEVIDRQVDRVNRMVEQFLRVAEIRSGRLTLRPERIDLLAVMTSVCEGLRQAASGRKIRCDGSESIVVVADPRSTELVLYNLVHNAIKYSPEGEEVRVNIAAHGGEGVVSVHDRGPGIPLEKQEHLFERFYQVQPGTCSQGGIGLGLYISRHLIESQGGRMWLESREGEGSTFYFALPIASDE